MLTKWRKRRVRSITRRFYWWNSCKCKTFFRTNRMQHQIDNVSKEKLYPDPMLILRQSNRQNHRLVLSTKIPHFRHLLIINITGYVDKNVLKPNGEKITLTHSVFRSPTWLKHQFHFQNGVMKLSKFGRFCFKNWVKAWSSPLVIGLGYCSAAAFS